jgi:hypothetical protein
MPEQNNKRPHFILDNTSAPQPFKSTSRGGDQPNTIPRERGQHGNNLLTQLSRIQEREADIFAEQEALGLERGFGLRIHFEGAEDNEMPIERLSRDSSGIELLNSRTVENKVVATVFVPEGMLDHFEKLIHQYLNEETAKGNPKNLSLINSIDQIRETAFSELWTDDNIALPNDENALIDWEIWLPVRDNRFSVLDNFQSQARHLGFEVSEQYLEFPERTVVSVRGTKNQITNSARFLDTIAEIRRVKETAEFFIEMPNVDQRDWGDELKDRITIPPEDSPFISILDTGVNNRHVLIQPLLDDDDLHTVNPDWGKDDVDGHGSGMAGLAIYGDLVNALETTETINLTHRLESIKILRHDGDNDHQHHGYLTREAISRAEITAPNRNRVTCMAVTSDDNRDRGRPSAWSATIDNLTSGALDDTPRLIIISAGNVNRDNWPNYPDGNSTDSIHDPGQAWNALTIGAYTNKVTIAAGAPNYSPLAPAGGLSPHSTTSATWSSAWPLKPDVVFEGGNVAVDNYGPISMTSLQLLTTYHQPQNSLFDYFDATSAATALASNMAASISAHYPQLWPEGIRALLVHSARWTTAMEDSYLTATPNTTHYEALVRHCGFGVPDLERAIWSGSNALTLISQESLQPFWKDGPRYKSKDMNLHTIPWPRESLLELGSAIVRMRVTLSYYIEPNPSDRGFSGRYRYASHGLRFDVKRADEKEDEFEARINLAARDEEAGTTFGGDGGGWLLGKQKRHHGSLHSDIWVGTAADLSNRQHLAVYPAIGWWRERHHLQRFTKRARYALIVSIETPETELDIYNEVATIVNIPVEIDI